jgi:hypothetical protein
LHRQKLFVALLAATLVIRIPAIVIAGYAWGMNAAVFALACSAAFNMVLWNACIAPSIGVSLGDFARCTWRTFAASAAMMLATAWLLAEWAPPLDIGASSVRLAVACLWGAAVQIAVQYGLWHFTGRPEGAEAQLLQITRSGLLQLLAPSRSRASP